VTSFNATNGPWLKPGIEDRLIELHAAGHSFREIAKMMSAEFGVELTKNAIVGRVHRLCLPLRVKPRECRQPRERKPIMIEIKPAAIVEAMEDPAPPPLSGIDFMELRFNDCRFPYGEFPNYRYCGKPQHRRSYCEAHFRLSYVLPRERWGG
jgi:hypothetical protein